MTSFLGKWGSRGGREGESQAKVQSSFALSPQCCGCVELLTFFKSIVQTMVFVFCFFFKLSKLDQQKTPKVPQYNIYS